MGVDLFFKQLDLGFEEGDARFHTITYRRNMTARLDSVLLISKQTFDVFQLPGHLLKLSGGFTRIIHSLQ